MRTVLACPDTLVTMTGKRQARAVLRCPDTSSSSTENMNFLNISLAL